MVFVVVAHVIREGVQGSVVAICLLTLQPHASHPARLLYEWYRSTVPQLHLLSCHLKFCQSKDQHRATSTAVREAFKTASKALMVMCRDDDLRGQHVVKTDLEKHVVLGNEVASHRVQASAKHHAHQQIH